MEVIKKIMKKKRERKRMKKKIKKKRKRRNGFPKYLLKSNDKQNGKTRSFVILKHEKK